MLRALWFTVKWRLVDKTPLHVGWACARIWEEYSRFNVNGYLRTLLAVTVWAVIMVTIFVVTVTALGALLTLFGGR